MARSRNRGCNQPSLYNRGKSFTRADLGEIRRQIEYWSNKVSALENVAKNKGRNRVYRIVPRDL